MDFHNEVEAGDVSPLASADTPVGPRQPSGIQSLPAQTHQPHCSDPPGNEMQQHSQKPYEQLDQEQQQQRLAKLREATTYHGAAFGQTGTSTRQELTAWIRVLAIPCRSMYATDSASMLNKALRLIQAAERYLGEKRTRP